MTSDNPAARLKTLSAIPAKERTLEQKAELLELKKKRIQQSAAKLSRQQASLREGTRKERTRRLIELGGLVAKAELDGLDAAALLGALLAVRKTISENPAVLATWKRDGGQALAATPATDTRVPLTVTLPSEPSSEMRKALKALRLRWSVLGHWEGIAEPAAVRSLVEPLGGNVQTIPTGTKAPPVAPSLPGPHRQPYTNVRRPIPSQG